MIYSHPFKIRHEDIIAAREAAHAAFDQQWKDGLCTKAEAYAWLSSVFQLPRNEAHIGRFTPEQCERVVTEMPKRMKKLRRQTVK